MCGNAGVSGTRQYMWIGGFPLWRAGKVWLWLNGRESFCGDSPEFDPVLSVCVIFWRFGGVADTQRQKKKIGISEWGRSFWSRLSFFFFSRANLNLPCVRTQCETRGAGRGQIMMSVKGVKNADLWDFFGFLSIICFQKYGWLWLRGEWDVFLPEKAALLDD